MEKALRRVMAQMFLLMWAPPSMDDVVIPISDPSPIELIKRSIRTAQIQVATATEFGFIVQYGQKKTELTIVLRNHNKSVAESMLRSTK